VTIQIQEEVKGKVDVAFVETVQFEVMRLKKKDNKQQKRIILLNLHKLKLKDKNGKRTIAKERYGAFEVRACLFYHSHLDLPVQSCCQLRNLRLERIC